MACVCVCVCDKRETQSIFTLILIITLFMKSPLRPLPLGSGGIPSSASATRRRGIFTISSSPLWGRCASCFSISAPSLAPHPCVLPGENQPLQHPVSFWGESRRLSYYCNDRLHSPLKISLCLVTTSGQTLFRSPRLLDLLCASSGRYIPGSKAELYLPLHKLKVNFPPGRRLFQPFKSHPPCFVSPAFIVSSAKRPSVRPLCAAVRLRGDPASRGK